MGNMWVGGEISVGPVARRPFFFTKKDKGTQLLWVFPFFSFKDSEGRCVTLDNNLLPVGSFQES